MFITGFAAVALNWDSEAPKNAKSVETVHLREWSANEQDAGRLIRQGPIGGKPPCLPALEPIYEPTRVQVLGA